MAINAQTAELIEVLRQEHHAMQEQMEKLQSVLNKSEFTDNISSLDNLACELRHLRVFMEAHYHKEANDLFPLLRARLNQKDWDIGLIEVEDRLLLERMNRLIADLTKPLHPLLAVQFRKELELIEREMIDHGKKEEEFLFSFLIKSGRIGPTLPYDPGAGIQGLVAEEKSLTAVRQVWAWFKAKFRTRWKR